MLPLSPPFGAGRQTVNKYAAIVYIRLNASMIKPKKKDYAGVPVNHFFRLPSRPGT